MKCSFPGCTKWKAINIPTPFCKTHFLPDVSSSSSSTIDTPSACSSSDYLASSSFPSTPKFQLGKVVEIRSLTRYEEVKKAAQTQEYVELHTKNLDSTHISTLCTELLKPSCVVSQLNLYLNPDIGYEGAKHLSQVIRNNTKLTVLNLKCCGLKHDGAMEIVHALETNYTLQVLSLEGNRTEHVVCEALLFVLRRTSPSSSAPFPTASSDLDFDGVSNDSRTDSSDSSSSNIVSASGYPSVLINGILTFPGHALRSLSLAFNSFGPEGGAALAELLRSGCALQELDVEGNNIGVESVKMIEALNENSCLTLLNLSCNNINDISGAALVRSLNTQIRHKKSSVLSTLLLAGNSLDLKSMRSLLLIVSLNSTLVNVDVRHNSDEEGAQQILVEFSLLVLFPMELCEIVSGYVFTKESDKISPVREKFWQRENRPWHG